MFDSERLVQALLVLVRVFVVAGISAVIPMLTILARAVTDPWLASMVIAVIAAVLSGILKYFGGATTEVIPASYARAMSTKRPNILAV